MSQTLRFLPSTPNLDLNAIIDILVVAFLVYQCLMVVRGTRAGPILVGILIMVSLYGLSLWAGLEALRSLLSFIVPYIGLAVIVLFQSEIRRTLARIGRKRLMGVIAGGFHAPESVSEILLAMEEMSAKKIGALIVLERDIGLRTFIESGVRLDSRLSRDLLISIFQPGLPLHDGAVIVRGDTIVGAGCILPLSQTALIDRSLGTRHRAALGLSEETDALVVVVSEETAAITVAVTGRLLRDVSSAQVRDLVAGRPIRDVISSAVDSGGGAGGRPGSAGGGGAGLAISS